MGHNGSGKSTLLRICSLLEAPDEGALSFFEGELPVHADLALRRRITLVLPRPAVFNAPVRANVAYGLKVRGLDAHEAAARTERALDSVGLTKKKNLNALTLSSGEAQRLALARAIVIRPELLFLDEPTAFIDRDNTKIVEELVLDLKKAGETGIIIATHDLAQAERLADRILVMNSGCLSERL